MNVPSFPAAVKANFSGTPFCRILCPFFIRSPFFSFLLDAIPAPLFLRDCAGKYLACNRAFEVFLGKTRKEIIGRSPFDFLPQETALAHCLRDQELLDQRQALVYTARVYDQPGMPRDIIFHKSILPSMWGGVTALVGVIQDMGPIADEIRLRKDLESIIESSPVIAWIWKAEPGWPVQYVSQNVVSLGYQSEDFRCGELSFVSIIHPEDAQRVAQEVEENTVRGCDEFIQEYRILTATGEVRWVDDRTRIKRSPEGLPLFYQGVLLDITDKKCVQNEFESIFNNSQVGIMFLKGGRTLFRGNQRLADMFGYPDPESMEGISMRDLHLDDRRFEEFGHEHYYQLTSGDHLQIEYEMRRRDGEAVWCSLSGRALNKNDLDQGVIWVIEDIGLFKKAQFRIESLLSRYELVLEGASGAVWDWDVELGQLTVSTRWRLLRACLPDEDPVSHYSLDYGIHPDDLTAFRNNLACFAGGTDVNFLAEYRLLRKDGSVRHVINRGKAVRAEDRRLLRMAGSEIDITALKEAELSLALALEEERQGRLRMMDMLEENNRIRRELEHSLETLKLSQDRLVHSEKFASLGRLVAEISHEINNPLMIISGNAELALLSRTVAVEERRCFESIVQECKRAKEVIHRVLRFARPSKGRVSLVNMVQCIESVVCILEKQYAVIYKIVIIRDYQAKDVCLVVDEQQLHEVFMNILTNAKEAMPEGGTITIITRLEGGFLNIEFRDTGKGMTPEVRKRIMEPFFTTKETGTGIGLAVCYGILKAHGGDLRYESEPGQGTIASLFIPLDSGIVTSSNDPLLG